MQMERLTGTELDVDRRGFPGLQHAVHAAKERHAARLQKLECPALQDGITLPQIQGPAQRLQAVVHQQSSLKDRPERRSTKRGILLLLWLICLISKSPSARL